MISIIKCTLQIRSELRPQKLELATALGNCHRKFVITCQFLLQIIFPALRDSCWVCCSICRSANKQ